MRLRTSFLFPSCCVLFVQVLTCTMSLRAEESVLKAQTAAKAIAATALPAGAKAMLSFRPIDVRELANERQVKLRDHHKARRPPVKRAMAEMQADPELQQLKARITPQTEPLAEPQSVQIVNNFELTPDATGGVTATVCEPSVVVTKGGATFVTGNWFAALSLSGGANFKFINPATFMRDDKYEFCCDQVALYDAKNDLVIWFLQYAENKQSRDNMVRVAVIKGALIGSGNWHNYDFRPTDINGAWTNEWFDFPELALSDGHLYVTSNSFVTVGDGYKRAVAFRVPLDKIANGQSITPDFIQSEDSFSLRPTHGASGTMHFGSHDFGNGYGRQIEVYSWPDNSSNVRRVLVPVEAWSDAERYLVCNDGFPWLNRADSRMTAAWVQGTRAGFAWSAATDPRHKQPHVRVAIVETAGSTTKTVAQPHLYNDKFAFAYPAAAVNAQGIAGVTVFYGGGRVSGTSGSGFNPSIAVGFLYTDADKYSWQLTTSHKCTNGPADVKWGDYQAVRPHPGKVNDFVSVSYVLDGGSDRQFIRPVFTHFSVTGAGSPPDPSPTPGGNEQLVKMLRETQAELESLKTRLEVLNKKIDDVLTMPPME